MKSAMRLGPDPFGLKEAYEILERSIREPRGSDNTTCKVMISNILPKAKVISIVILVKEHTHYGLKASKELMERVLLQESVELEFANTENAIVFVEEANKLGAQAYLKNDN